MAESGYVQRYDSNGRTVEHGVKMYVNLTEQGGEHDALHLHFTSPTSGISKNYYIKGEALAALRRELEK